MFGKGEKGLSEEYPCNRIDGRSDNDKMEQMFSRRRGCPKLGVHGCNANHKQNPI